MIDRIQKGIELERRAAAGDKQAEWELVALEKELNLDRPRPEPRTPEEIEQAAEARRHSNERGTNLYSLDALIRTEPFLDEDVVQRAIEKGLLTVAIVDGSEHVQEREFERFITWSIRRAVDLGTE